MKSRLIVPLALGVALLTGPAIAGVHDHDPGSRMAPKLSDAALHDECKALELQFDMHAISGEDVTLDDPVEKLRDDGASLCALGQSGAGIAKLKAALREIGASPPG